MRDGREGERGRAGERVVRGGERERGREASSLSRLPPSRALSCMRAYARLTGRRRKISPPDGNCFRREKRREEESLPLSRSLSLSRLPPSRALSYMRAYARLTGRRRKISPRVSSRRKLLPSREEAGGGKSSSLPLVSLSLSRPPSLSRLPPSSYLGDAEPAAGYLPTPALQRQLKSRAPPPLSLLPRI